MKKSLYLIVILFTIPFFGQKKESKTHSGIEQIKSFIENRNGEITSDPNQIANFLKINREEINLNTQNQIPFSKIQNTVHLCSNGNFEEFESVNGSNVLKNFQYGTGEPLSPKQCKSISVPVDQYISQHNPANGSLMASTVPSNYIDRHIGNINAFDQYALKINYEESSITSSIVQAKRFKTNNENSVVFNFKAVLQSIEGSGHLNEQPYFKGRILDKNGVLVDEFCLIGDPENCIFTESGNSQFDVILFTENWQTGSLDISSIPNNEEFTIEFMASRCGLGGHFGYAFIDDICLIHSDENLQGSIELDPLYEICPSMPISVCGTFTIPNSGVIAASVDLITMNVYDETDMVIYTSTTPTSVDLTNNTFCFEINSTDLPNTTTGNYNIGVSINYGITQNTCVGTNFATATDTDSNPGWDISFLNCRPDCNFNINPETLTLCDGNSDGKEFFNLTNAENTIIGNQTGLSFSYYPTLTDATNNTNAIINTTNYESYTTTVFVRVIKDATCYKIIAIQLVVRNPTATISGILNLCNGSTTLTASTGVSYLWSTGETTNSIDVTTIGTYSVDVTDSFGCVSNGTVTIIPNQVAVSPTLTISQPDCLSTTGTIVVTSPATSYSFDGGITWSTNPQATNLNPGIYNVRIRTVAGCESYDSPVSINAYNIRTPNVVVTQPNVCGDYGNILISSVASEYSFDDGITWSTSNYSGNLPTGNYTVRIKSANGCISNPNNVTIAIVSLNTPTVVAVNPYCSVLGSITITTVADFYSFDNGATWQTSNVLSNLNPGNYITLIKNNLGCTSPSVTISLYASPPITPLYTITPAGCNQYASLTINTVGDEYSFDGGITWSTSNTLTNLNGGTIYPIKVKLTTNCYSLIANANITSTFLPLPIVTNYSDLICDDLNNGSENIDLTSYNNEFISNSTNYTIKYYTTLIGAQNEVNSDLITNFNAFVLNVPNKIIYVKIIDSNNCSSIAELHLSLEPTPVIHLNETYYLCENYSVTINENSAHETYLWSTGETTSSIILFQPGNYSLTVTKTHGNVICSTTKNYEVILSNPATITSIIPSDWTLTHNILTINTTGLGNYEYSLNGIDYQDSNIFTDLENGEYTVYVRDKFGCGVNSDEIYLLMHPTYFTPNGDGYNDFWKIKFSENEPNLTVKIFDRYGKFIKQIGANSKGWDGTYLGQKAASTDYWFVVTRENGREYRGHFTLKR